MNANELMIGDWVLYSGAPIQINEILHYGINGDWDGSECYGVCEYNELRPIPITPKILEKNGFERYFEGYYKNPKELHINFLDNTERWYIYGDHEDYIHENIIASFYMVHELQHILRILGYNELANNFKI